YVGDVARANLLALESTATGPFNIGTGIETDVNTLARLLLEATGGRSEVRYGPTKAGEQRRSVIDSRRAAEVLGWRPEVSLADGLGRTVEWFRKRAAGPRRRARASASVRPTRRASVTMMRRATAAAGPACAMTLEEWAALDEEVEGELVDGVLEEEEMPSFLHEIVVAWLIRTLHTWARRRRGLVASS